MKQKEEIQDMSDEDFYKFLEGQGVSTKTINILKNEEWNGKNFFALNATIMDRIKITSGAQATLLKLISSQGLFYFEPEKLKYKNI